MELLNILIAVLLLLSAAAGAWLTRTNQTQAAHIAELESDNKQLMLDNTSMYERGVVQGRAEREAELQTESLYLLGEERGYTKALHDFAAGACEMQLVRESGELNGKVLD